MVRRKPKVSKLIERGDFNFMNRYEDGTTSEITIEIHRHGWKRKYQMKKRLRIKPDGSFEETPEVLKDEEVQDAPDEEAGSP